MQKEVYKALRDVQDKYVYFLLTATGAAVAFAVTQTQTAKLAWTQAPLGFALLFWGLSFFCGCRHIQHSESTLFANASYFEVLNGADPELGSDPRKIAIAAGAITKAAQSHSNSAGFTRRWQFRFLITGCAAYLVWHVLEMYARALA